MDEEKNLFERAMAVDPDAALKMALEATETEEKRFYTFIADMTLQRRDRQVFRERLEKRGEER